jgi:single-stranded-DNA-specific exonuclease
MSDREWIIAAPHPDRDALASSAGVSPLLAQVLLSRGVASAAAISAFLQPQYKQLHSPADLPGAVEAAERLHAAVAAGRKIVVYGDYDVDGITGTAILWHAIRLAGGKVSFYIPSRLDEGYGVNGDALRELHTDGASLVITVDCGITAVEQARLAKDLGLDLIITDHHQPQATLPDAACIVHPTAVGKSPNPDLCGAAVALKVAWALGQKCAGAGRVQPEWAESLQDATALAALGLIADVVPLTGENRVITTFGLKRLRTTQNHGLRALLDVSGLTSKDSYDDYDVGFKLAPRLNAIGRLGHARLAVELFTRAGPEQAHQIAETLDDQNRKRQTVERGIVKEAEALVSELGFDRDGCRGIVLASSKWHAGVIGIVASRLVDRFHRPTVLIALEGDQGQGSGRSIRHFPLHEVLDTCSEHLISHGGHAMAAGIKVTADRIEDFTQAFLEQAANRLTPQDLTPKLHLDDEVPLSMLQLDVVNTLNRLAPFGPGNPRVRLATQPVEITGEPRAVGKSAAHVQFSVRDGSEVRKAIAFGRGGEIDQLNDHRRLQLAFEPSINEWQGHRSVQLKVIDWRLLD